MEHLHVPHDFQPENMGYFALKAVIDELFAASDKRVFEILNKYKDDPDA